MTSTGGKHWDSADGQTIGAPWHSRWRTAEHADALLIMCLCARSQEADGPPPYASAQHSDPGPAVPSFRDDAWISTTASPSPAQSRMGALTVFSGHWNTP